MEQNRRRRAGRVEVHQRWHSRNLPGPVQGLLLFLHLHRAHNPTGDAKRRRRGGMSLCCPASADPLTDCRSMEAADLAGDLLPHARRDKLESSERCLTCRQTRRMENSRVIPPYAIRFVSTAGGSAAAAAGERRKERLSTPLTAPSAGGNRPRKTTAEIGDCPPPAACSLTRVTVDALREERRREEEKVWQQQLTAGDSCQT